MSKMKSATGRPQEFAYFISGPLVLLTAALLIPLGTRTPPTVHELPLFAVYLVLFVLAIVPSVIACLAVWVTPKRQAWHDKLTGMVVVKRQ